MAYLLPILHKLLSAEGGVSRVAWQALILVPTRELCHQVCCWFGSFPSDTQQMNLSEMEGLCY